MLPDSHEIPVITGRVIAVGKAIENDEDQTIRQYDKVLFDPREAIPVELEHDNRLFVVHIDRVLAIFQEVGCDQARHQAEGSRRGISMPKKVVLVGHCGPDSSYLTMAVKSASSDIRVSAADSDAEIEREIARGADLLLLNRVLDYGFAQHTGVDLLRNLKKKHPQIKAMLVSNYSDAQEAALAEGAFPGFGKHDIWLAEGKATDSKRTRLRARTRPRVTGGLVASHHDSGHSAGPRHPPREVRASRKWASTWQHQLHFRRQTRRAVHLLAQNGL